MKPCVSKETVTPEATLSPEVMEAMKLVSPVLGVGALNFSRLVAGIVVASVPMVVRPVGT